MSPGAPPYFDALLDEHRAGRGPEHVHLGHWDDPPPLDRPCLPGEFARAQTRLSEILVGMAGIEPRHRVLDVGCGFGGPTRMAQAAAAGVRAIGLNIDPRQLGICRRLSGAGGPAYLAGDACRLPFADGAFDRVLCIEAMFHFASRHAFLAEAARVLRPGGRLVVSDILLVSPGRHGPAAPARLETVLREGYGPWPEPWTDRAALERAAAAAGLAPTAFVDATAQTLPSYRVTAPRPLGARHPALSAGTVLRWLQSRGFAHSVYGVFEPCPAAAPAPVAPALEAVP